MRTGGAIPRLTVGESLSAPGTGKVQGRRHCGNGQSLAPRPGNLFTPGFI